MNEAAARWIGRLPWRWAAGGLVLGSLWLLLSVGLTSGLSSSADAAGMWVRLFSAFVMPLAILGGIWGASEQRRLRRAARSDAGLERAVQRFLLRQVGKSMIAGLVFAVFIYASGVATASDPSVAAIIDHASTLIGFVILAVPIGVVVGLVSGRALKRRLAKDAKVARVF